MAPIVSVVYRILSLMVVIVLLMLTVPAAWAKKNVSVKTFEVIGTSSIRKDNIAAARDIAIANSLVTAVSLATRDILEVDAMVRNFENLNNVLLKDTAPYIRNYKVLTETTSEKTYRVMVQVSVSLARIRKQLTAIGFVLDRKIKAKILLFIAEQNLDEISRYWWGKGSAYFYGAAEKALAETMRSKGFRIMRHGRMPPGLDLSELAETPDLNNLDAANIAANFGVDVAIIGSAVSQRASNVMGEEVGSFEGVLNLRAIRIDTGEEIASLRQSAVTADVDEYKGGKDALSNAGTLAAEILSSRIAAALQKVADQAGTVKIHVKGTRILAHFAKFRRALNEIQGVKNLKTQEMTTDQATLLVEYQGDAKKLAEGLMLKSFDSFGVNIYEILDNVLRIEFVAR